MPQRNTRVRLAGPASKENRRAPREDTNPLICFRYGSAFRNLLVDEEFCKRRVAAAIVYPRLLGCDDKRRQQQEKIRRNESFHVHSLVSGNQATIVSAFRTARRGFAGLILQEPPMLVVLTIEKKGGSPLRVNPFTGEIMKIRHFVLILGAVFGGFAAVGPVRAQGVIVPIICDVRPCRPRPVPRPLPNALPGQIDQARYEDKRPGRDDACRAGLSQRHAVYARGNVFFSDPRDGFDRRICDLGKRQKTRRRGPFA